MTLLREDKTKKTDYTYLALTKGATDRLCRRFMHGEEKYARANWRECKDNQTYKESAIRHLIQYMGGQTDEDHLAAATCNLFILMDLEDER